MKKPWKRQEDVLDQPRKRPLTERERSGCSALRTLTEKDIRESIGDKKVCESLAIPETPNERKVLEPVMVAQKPSQEQQSIKLARTGK